MKKGKEVMKDLKIKDFREVEKLMTDEQKAVAEKRFREVYPEGTPEIMCVSEDPERDYLEYVDLEDFD